MKNNVNFKKYLFLTVIISICFLFLFLILNMYEYNVYNKNFNDKISAIVNKLRADYNEVSDNEIIEILNSYDTNSNFFTKYGIDIKNDSILLKNEKCYNIFLILNISFLFIVILVTIAIFFIYDKKKNKDIKEITKYIEEINKKNYSLNIDSISEDELSILKNEIYKTTIALKESAENSLKDKKDLKNSLEDISHQLKTPITSILVALDNLIDDPNMDSSLRDDFIRDIKREVTNINFLVQAILKLSKFDSNTVKYIKEKILVKNLIDTAIKNVSSLCDLRNIEINVSGNENITLNCDFKWQVEAITNIIKNCIEYSKEGGKVIINYEKNNVYVLISIKDFGSGISKKDLPHIFERFYKGENSSQDSIGIGLALAKTIIEQDNGNIDVLSTKNGTTFVIKYFLL